jgi:copper(I)-binding protein
VLSGWVPAALGLGLAALLAGCGSGQITQTDTQEAAVNGANGTVGAIAIRDAQLAYPAASHGVYAPGSTAVLVLTIVNTGINDDQLVKITTPAALGVTIDGAADGTKDLPGGFAVHSGTDMDDESLSAAPAPATTSSEPMPSGDSMPSGAPTATSSAAPVAPAAVRIVLTGIRSYNGGSLRAGLTIPVTFYFAHAGSVTLTDVPIGAPADGSATPPSSAASNG